MSKTYDFCGWATKNNIKCSDGRTILQDAFKHNDGMVVPLVWQHQHNNVENVLGHALLENRPEGVYTYGYFNDTEFGQNAKLMVQHGDITRLSIFANHLKQDGGNVMHGDIKEVSLVLAGANPGAEIESISFAHSEDGDVLETLIYPDEDIACHADEEQEAEKGETEMADKTVGEIYDEMTDEQKEAVNYLVEEALNESVEHSDMNEEDAQNDGTEEDSVEHSDDEGDYEMKKNVFDAENQEMTLSHADVELILDDAKRLGSLKESVLAHAEELGEYGITNIDYLFPDYKKTRETPDFINRDQTWVDVVMKGVHHIPFSRIKSVHADITPDEARAKGYVKGNLKMEEVFELLKRTTDPQTVYKKQKLDRDDIIDITDFNVVAWLKQEMRGKLDEELARAFLIGDGRSAVSADKIKADHIRPIWGDSELYTVNKVVELAESDTLDKKLDKFITACVKSRKDYKGSGNPVMFMSEDMRSDLLLMKDGIGHRLYKNVEELATALLVSKIVTVPYMENLTRSASGSTYKLEAIIVNLNDYNVGADKGGAVSMFEDFDIDYNQEKYLIETRCSAALDKPYSAITIETTSAASVG